MSKQIIYRGQTGDFVQREWPEERHRERSEVMDVEEMAIKTLWGFECHVPKPEHF